MSVCQYCRPAIRAAERWVVEFADGDVHHDCRCPACEWEMQGFTAWQWGLPVRGVRVRA
jgi:hypothetical protein